MSERRACAALGVSLSVQRYKKKKPEEELRLRVAIVELSRLYPRYGYRRTAALLQADGWRVSRKRVARIRSGEGLQARQRIEKPGRVYLRDGSCVRLTACYRSHVWSYDFVMDRFVPGHEFQPFARYLDRAKNAVLCLLHLPHGCMGMLNKKSGSALSHTSHLTAGCSPHSLASSLVFARDWTWPDNDYPNRYSLFGRHFA